MGRQSRPFFPGRSDPGSVSLIQCRDHLQQIRQLYDERRPLYAAATDSVFPINTTDYGQVIADLAQRLRTIESSHA